MYLDDFTARIYSAEKGNRFIAEAEADRAITRARARNRAGTTSALERLGTALIGLGRTLCERRGVHVEVAFRPGAAGAGGDGRSVA